MTGGAKAGINGRATLRRSHDRENIAQIGVKPCPYLAGEIHSPDRRREGRWLFAGSKRPLRLSPHLPLAAQSQSCPTHLAAKRRRHASAVASVDGWVDQPE